jgi:hypothetical protein
MTNEEETMTTTNQSRDGTDVDPREDNLPKWAQTKLQTLRMRLREEREAKDQIANSTVFMDPYADEPIGLGQNPNIEWQLPARGNQRNRYIQVRRDGDEVLRITSDDSLLIQPRSTNGIEVRSHRL